MSNVVPFASPVVASKLTIDFLRLTREIDDTVTNWMRPIRHDMDDMRLAGHKPTGYVLSTMQGVRVGQGAWAKSKTHALVEARGGCAERIYPFYTETKSKATRIDIALTIWLADYDGGVAHWCYDTATRYMVEKGMAERRRMPILTGGLDGWTCYLGARQSDRFFRIYDKDKQSGDTAYKAAWRFEIECKGDVAANLWERLRKPDTRAHIMQSEVVSYLEKYGMVLKGFNATFSPTKTGAASVPADVTRKIAWLSKQVRPVLKDLFERGFEVETYQALDIPYDSRENLT